MSDYTPDQSWDSLSEYQKNQIRELIWQDSQIARMNEELEAIEEEEKNWMEQY